MSEPADMIVPLLREMRSENLALHGQTGTRLELIERRLAKLEDQQVSCRRALSADSLLGKLLTGEFEERLEAKVRELEGHK